MNLKDLFPQLFTEEYKECSMYINKKSPLLQKIAYIFWKLHYHKEMFRLRNHIWKCPDCGNKSHIVGYACQLTIFKCDYCKKEFDVEGY